MSANSTKNKVGGWENQRGSTGLNTYNPAQNDYNQKFDFDPAQKARELSDMENSWNAPYQGKNGNSLRENEQEPDAAPRVTNANRTSSQERRDNRVFNRNVLTQVFTGKSIRQRSSLITLALLLFGGGGFLTVLLSPSLAIIQMKEVFTKSLNDQLHSVEERSTVLLRSKLKETTKGSCGAIKIGCRFATISDRQVEKFKAVGVEVKTTPKSERKWFNQGRGQILEINYVDQGGVTTIKSAGELHSSLMGNMPFRAAMMKGYNPLFASLTDKVALGVMHTLKTSKRLVATGADDKERQKNVNAAVGGLEDSGARTVIKTKDEDGKEVYTDSEGNELSAAEVEAAREGADRGEQYAKTGGIKSVLSGAVKGASIVGYMDSACTVYNSIRFVSALAKVKKQAQAARFAMAMVLTPADSIKSGDANPDDVEFVGKNLTEVRLASDSKVLDESQLSKPGSAANPPLVSDPDVNKNAFDSPGYQLAADPSVTPTVNLRASQFMVGGGSVSLLDGVLASVATIVNGGDSNPQGVSQKCRYIQNPAVRFTGLAVGIIAGIGSFGLTTALGIAGSMAIALALPYVESQAADIIAGNLFKDLSGIDSGDAAYVGSAGLFGMMAMNRGMKPLNKKEGLKQLASNQATYDEYVATQQYLARDNPFDLNNQYSFMGSLASTITPLLQRSKSSASAAMINVGSLIPTAFASLSPSAKAVAGDYFDHCNDQGYQAAGIAAGPFCEVRYGNSEEELAMDPLQNVDWMAANGEIDPDSETGEAKDNKQDWNYVKFLEQCTNRTVGWGENQDENEGDGSNCVDPAKEDKNKHYRIYTLDKTVDASMDGSAPGNEMPGSTGFTDGKNGEVNADGWAFPTDPKNTIIKGFHSTQDPGYQGVDIAGKNDFQTQGQPIFAAYAGKVIAAGPHDKYGNWIAIEHQINGQTMTTVYARMNHEGVLVHVGDNVVAGQEIGFIGDAGGGRAYLYFELRRGNSLADGNQIDPTPFLEAARTKKPEGEVANV